MTKPARPPVHSKLKDIMQRIKYILTLVALAAILLVMPACTTTDPATGQPVPDPVKTEKVVAVMRNTTANLAIYVLDKEPDSRPHLVAAHVIMCSLVNPEKPITPDEFRKALSGVTSGRSDASAELKIAINTIVGLYDIAYADRARADIAASSYAYHVLNTLCLGLSDVLTPPGA